MFPPIVTLVRNNEMLEVDECSNDEQRNEDPIRQRDLPGKVAPDGEKQETGQEFHGEVAEGDAASAVRAAPSEKKPAQERDILIPLELLLAGWAKGAPRLVHGKIEWHSINADVQKGADHRPENEREGREEKMINRRASYP